jgi:ferrochelatase
MKIAKTYNLDKKVKTIDSYYENKNYNKAIVERIKQTLKEGENSEDFELIFSAHGLTQRIVDKGDLYQKHILANVECAKKELKEQGIKFKKIHVAYQSRLGPMEWLRPYLEDKLAEIESKVILYPISFTVDNSETEYELDMEYLEVAEELGLEDYRVAKTPNHHPLFMEAIKEIYEGMK